jgi:DNA-directed RNA polymerase alpha subunit
MRARDRNPQRDGAAVALPPRLAALCEAARLAPFTGRGLGHRTINALVSAGIDAPERLLFMTPTQLAHVPGIGKISMAEIANYRSKFLPAG